MEPHTDARPRGDAGDPVSGRLLDGRYRIGSRIARGGMASVYEATDLRLQRTVAVKVMHPGLGDDEEFASRFVREARAAARLSHPHVVNVYDQGEDDGTIFLAMEYVPGHTLRDVIRKESPMAPGRALALVEPVLSALGAAHRAGLIHRDIKPENVLIADDGRVKVADFGLAKAVSTDTQHTATGGVLIGTVSYLAPELVVDGSADARADVYAVGVVLYELLTGRKPHEGESPIQVAYKHVHEDVPAPSAAVPGLPPYVDALVARATSRDRDQRPADAQVLLHQLHRVGHALGAGVVDDPELTSDLMPRRPFADRDAALGIDTQPEPFDAFAFQELTEGPTIREIPAGLGHEPTTTLDRAQHETGGPPSGLPRSGAAPSRRPRRSRRGLALLLVALLIAGLGGSGAWWYGVGRYISSPGVIGLSEAAAVTKIEAAGLVPALGEPAYSETVPAGEVISSDPSAGSRILDGDTVTLVLSLGKERYDVPELAGRTVARAERMLGRTQLTLGSITERFHENEPTGTVLSSNPAAGTTLRPGTAVDLVVSKGRKPVKVRDFTGKSAAKARSVLSDRGLRVSTSEAFSDSVAEGVVISQDPTTGTLFRGDEVRLVVSKGPELVTVPDGLVRSGVADATERLEALGFKVTTERSELYLGLGFVASVSPGEGEQVRKGSTITLYLV
ncbi:Stk1 family PASTA domain-containing Ser/Thr kinase [Nocardioides sp.]|uniref:Stk1 family PASTA domain-containing Ser/Thr kinase n=1 Tax=Nocardioides sp. TaxID=35761 RepID=UPI0027362ADC|nr:Stk1 family PASTA domain-containing Ser/Thr kinase [Nocardioides sp.]MDP3893815.1 Stk1 family PASTA domain-containing Ser/Thr kinase [Nocardioides sp.]